MHAENKKIKRRKEIVKLLRNVQKNQVQFLTKNSYKAGGNIEMPFVQIDVNKEIEKQMEKPKFKKAWDENHAEYELIGEMISLRKQKKISQSELAMLIGNKQQVISRIERRENNPSLKMFANILDVLGYELKIVKKTKV